MYSTALVDRSGVNVGSDEFGNKKPRIRPSDQTSISSLSAGSWSSHSLSHS